MHLLRHSSAQGHESLWGQGGATMQDVTLQDGRTVRAPFFDTSGIAVQELSRDDLDNEKGRKIGSVIELIIEVDGEMPRAARLWRVDEKHARNPDVYSASGAALYTGIHPDGYGSALAHQLSSVERVSHLQRGNEASHNHTSVIKSFFDPVAALQAAVRARQISLMRSSAHEQAAEAAIREQYGLPVHNLQTGDSQAAIRMPGTVFYNEQLGGNVVGIFPRATLCHEALTVCKTPEGLKWLSSQALGLVAIAGDAIQDGDFEQLRELFYTPDFHAPFVVSTTLGSMPALLRGELGTSRKFLRRTISGAQTVFGNDHLLRSRAKAHAAKFPHLETIKYATESHVHVVENGALRDEQVMMVGRAAELANDVSDFAQLTPEQRAQLYARAA